VHDIGSQRTWINKESTVYHAGSPPPTDVSQGCFQRNITWSYTEVPCCSAFTRPSLCSSSERSLYNLLVAVWRKFL